MPQLNLILVNPADLSSALLTVVTSISASRGGTRVLTIDDLLLERPRNRIDLAGDRTYLKCRESVLKFLYERHRFVEAA